MFLSYNFASDRGVTSLFLFNGVAVDDYFDAGKQKSWRRVFRNLLRLSDSNVSREHRCIVERDCDDLTTSIDDYIKRTEEASINQHVKGLCVDNRNRKCDRA